MRLLIVPASHGVKWVQSGIRTFWRQPLALAALFFMLMATMSLLSLLPLVGPVVGLALLPAAQLTMMVASAEALQGRFPQPFLLWVAFRSQPLRQNMLQLGALYAAGFLAVMALTAVVDGGQFAQVYLGGEPLTREVAQSEAFQGAMWLGLILYVPLSLLFWHAPGLVYWHGVTPIKALFFSFMTCKRNFWAFALFVVTWGIALLIAGLILAIATGFITVFLGLGAQGLLIAGAMVLAAMFFTSIVFTFRDCFEPPLI